MKSNTTSVSYEENRDLDRAKDIPDSVEEEEAVHENTSRILFGHDIVIYGSAIRKKLKQIKGEK